MDTTITSQIAPFNWFGTNVWTVEQVATLLQTAPDVIYKHSTYLVNNLQTKSGVYKVESPQGSTYFLTHQSIVMLSSSDSLDKDKSKRIIQSYVSNLEAETIKLHIRITALESTLASQASLQPITDTITTNTNIDTTNSEITSLRGYNEELRKEIDNNAMTIENLHSTISNLQSTLSTLVVQPKQKTTNERILELEDSINLKNYEIHMLNIATEKYEAMIADLESKLDEASLQPITDTITTPDVSSIESDKIIAVNGRVNELETLLEQNKVNKYTNEGYHYCEAGGEVYFSVAQFNHITDYMSNSLMAKDADIANKDVRIEELTLTISALNDKLRHESMVIMSQQQNVQLVEPQVVNNNGYRMTQVGGVWFVDSLQFTATCGQLDKDKSAVLVELQATKEQLSELISNGVGAEVANKLANVNDLEYQVRQYHAAQNNYEQRIADLEYMLLTGQK